jgi:hypothetical protein
MNSGEFFCSKCRTYKSEDEMASMINKQCICWPCEEQMHKEIVEKSPHRRKDDYGSHRE